MTLVSQIREWKDNQDIMPGVVYASFPTCRLISGEINESLGGGFPVAGFYIDLLKVDMHNGLPDMLIRDVSGTVKDLVLTAEPQS
jgi:hypothetical protein